MTDTAAATATATDTTLKTTTTLDLSDYSWTNVTNAHCGKGREFFNYGLRLLLAYQHELAAKYFADCVAEAPDCVLAHALIAYCHGPNYNFKGERYYMLSYDYTIDGDHDHDHDGEERFTKDEHEDEDDGSGNGNGNGNGPKCRLDDDTDPKEDPPFPSQIVADRHSLQAIQIVDRLNDIDKTTSSTASNAIQDLEVQLIKAIRILTCDPGMDPSIAETHKDIPFSHAMRKIYESYPHNPDVAFIFVASIMTIYAWKLFEYPTGRPLSSDIIEVQTTLETSLKKFPDHTGLCHMYCHLCEMSSYPDKALSACDVLRTKFPDAGHLLHMPTHIDVLIGDYESCVRWNMDAIKADKKAMELYPKYNNQTSFYFGYIVHDYHMLIYGAILGAMEGIAMEVAKELNSFIHEGLFREEPDLTVYLESYAAMDIHILFRFGRWSEILRLKFPKDSNLMLYRSASLYYARAVAYANLGDIQAAKQEAKCFEKLRANPTAKNHILHNNVVSDLLDVDSVMMEGEIAYFDGKYGLAFEKLRLAVELQDELKYDEPWGKMQPVRHALGGLLLKQGFVEDAEDVFRKDLVQHPKNPWALVGLIDCLNVQLSETEGGASSSPCSRKLTIGSRDKKKYSEEERSMKTLEREKLQEILDEQRKCLWADFNVIHSCACV